MDLPCLCGKLFSNPAARGAHYRECKIFWWKLRAEYRRIQRIVGHEIVRGTEWDKNRNQRFPRYTSIAPLTGNWAVFQAWAGDGEVVVIAGKPVCIPGVPDEWDQLLGDRKFVSRGCPIENIVQLLCAMFEVARSEKRGVLSHWNVDFTGTDTSVIQQDAIEWLEIQTS